jgi:hypothetical protein
MKKTHVIIFILYVLIVLLCIASAVMEVRAQETYIWWLPIMYDNYNPQRAGCELPGTVNCNSGPPFSPPNLFP